MMEKIEKLEIGITGSVSNEENENHAHDFHFMREIFFQLTIILCLVSCGGAKDGDQSSTENKKPALQKKLSITFDYEIRQGKIQFTGKTNLPDNTKLGISLRNNEGFFAQDYNIFVKNGTFSSETFSNKGKALKGSYDANLVTYFTPRWQTENMIDELMLYEGDEIIKKNDEILGYMKGIEINKKIEI